VVGQTKRRWSRSNPRKRRSSWQPCSPALTQPPLVPVPLTYQGKSEQQMKDLELKELKNGRLAMVSRRQCPVHSQRRVRRRDCSLPIFPRALPFLKIFMVS